MEKIEVCLHCEDGDIVYHFYDDEKTKRASFLRLDADLAEIDQRKEPIDFSDVNSEWETPLGKSIGEMFKLIDSGEYNE